MDEFDQWTKGKCKYSNQNFVSTFYLSPIVMFAISVTVSGIFEVEMYTIVTLTFRMGHGQMQIYQSKVTSYVLAIAMLVLSVRDCEIII